MVRLILGVAKGAAIGAGLGFGAYQLGLWGGWNYLLYGLVGLLVGMLVGRPIWSHLRDKRSTVWTSVLKGLFGFGVCLGFYALIHAVFDPELSLSGATHRMTDWGFLFGGVVGALYGTWLELDDADDPKREV